MAEAAELMELAVNTISPRDSAASPANEPESTGRRLVSVLAPLVLNYPFTVKSGRVQDLFEKAVPFTPQTYLPYVALVTFIGSILLPVISMYGYVRLVLSERNLRTWSVQRLGALVLATAAVIAQCELSRAWTVESPLGRWWSLLLFFGIFVSRAVEVLAPILTLVIAVRWATVRGRRHIRREERHETGF